MGAISGVQARWRKAAVQDGRSEDRPLQGKEHRQECVCHEGARVVSLVDPAGDGDAGLAEDVGDLGLAKARGVVFESEMVVLFVDAEAAETVGVGELTQAAELLEAERGLQFEGDVEECHGRGL